MMHCARVQEILLGREGIGGSDTIQVHLRRSCCWTLRGHLLECNKLVHHLEGQRERQCGDNAETCDREI